MPECDFKDDRQPFSFKEFLRTNPAIEPRDDRLQYQAYLVKWFEKHYADTDSQLGVVQMNADFQQVLKRLFILFKADPVFEEFGEINFDNETEVKMLLPVFAQKLKKIALYLTAKRESIKRTKLRASTIGSRQGIESALYEYLLKNFTERGAITSAASNVTVIGALENLDNVKEVFNIQVQELYEKGNGGK